jgi:hypothetical protein
VAGFNRPLTPGLIFECAPTQLEKEADTVIVRMALTQCVRDSGQVANTEELRKPGGLYGALESPVLKPVLDSTGIVDKNSSVNVEIECLQSSL